MKRLKTQIKSVSRHSCEIFTIGSQRSMRVFDDTLTAAPAFATNVGAKLAALLILVITLLFNGIVLVTKQADLAFHQVQEVLLFSKSNYKVYADIGGSTACMWRRTVVIDTGAGPNCIAKSAIPAGSEDTVSPPPNIRVKGANGSPLGIEGQVSLAVRVGTAVIKVPFLVCDSLPVDALLGTEFIDRHVRDIHVEDRSIELKDGTEVPILRSTFGQPPTDQPVPALQTDKKTKARPTSNKIRVAKQVLLQPHSQTWVSAVSQRKGSVIIEPKQTLSDQQLVSASNGIAQVRPEVPFRLLVANFGDQPTRLHKGQVIAHAFAHPAFIAKTEVTLAEVLNIQVDQAEPAQSKTPIGAEQDTSILTRNLKSKSVSDIPLDGVDKKWHASIRAMLAKHSSMWDGRLGKIAATEHRIDLKNDVQPVRQNPYRSGHKEREFAREEIEKMLKAGVIEPSNSEWASPIVLAPKKDGSLRFCVDYRRLNAVTQRDSYPLPRMDDCVDSLGSATIFTTLDANWGYWQLPVREKDKAKTAFCSYEGLYQFKRMPFGLTNAPASFQRALDVILAPYKWKSCLVYLDDVIVFSADPAQHIKHVDFALTALRKAGISLKIDKCQFFTQKVKYLGHIVRPGSIEVDQAATKSLREAKPPETLTQLKSFLGFVNVYRRFIPEFTKTAQPLYDLQKDVKGKRLPPLTEVPIAAFNALIKAVLDPVILSIPKQGLKYSLDTDASDYQVGCALFQTAESGERKPIGFWSRTLNSAERNYSVPERECLAVVYGITTCRPYLFGEKFDVFTDQNCLRWLMLITDPSGRLMRWRLRLAEYEFEVNYKKGKLNNQADALSRLPSNGHTTEHEDTEPPCLIVDVTSNDWEEGEDAHPFIEEADSALDALVAEPAENQVLPAQITLQELIHEQAGDRFCQDIRTALEREGRMGFRESPHTGALERALPKGEGGYAVVVPASLQPRLLRLAHYPQIAGHPGGRKMYQTLRKRYYWPGLALSCYHTVRACAACARERILLQANSTPLRLFPPSGPLEDVAMDILCHLHPSGRGHTNLLVIVDRFTKLVRAVPMKGTNAFQIAKAFTTNWAFVYGVPKTVLTDNGPQFCSKFLRQTHRILGAKPQFTTTYHPKANGQTERFNRTILASLRRFIADHPKDWDMYADALTYAYNNQVHAATGCTPMELVLSRAPPHLAMEQFTPELKDAHTAREQWLSQLGSHMGRIRHNLNKAQQRYKDNFDRRLRQRRKEFTTGGYAFLRVEKSSERPGRRHKLAPVAAGPFPVIRIGEQTIIIERPSGIREEVSIDRAEPAPIPPGSIPFTPALLRAKDSTAQTGRPEPTDKDAASNLYEVERVTDHVQDPDAPAGHLLYQVRWVRYAEKTWETAQNLRHNMIVRYHNRHKLALPPNIGDAMEG